MTSQEKDRIECAIRHIKTAIDVDPWAAEIAVEALEKQLSNHSEIPNSSDDLIRRQAAIDTSLEFFVEFLGGAFHENAQKELMARIQRLPSAQPEIVRCKECKYRDADDFCTGRGYPNVLVPDDGFCDKGDEE